MRISYAFLKGMAKNYVDTAAEHSSLTMNNGREDVEAFQKSPTLSPKAYTLRLTDTCLLHVAKYYSHNTTALHILAMGPSSI
jgi:hypothetical protein